MTEQVLDDMEGMFDSRADLDLEPVALVHTAVSWHRPIRIALHNVSIATIEIWKNRNTGEPQERTERQWVVFFG